MGWDTTTDEKPCWCGKGTVRITQQSHDSFSYSRLPSGEIRCPECSAKYKWSAQAQQRDGMWEPGFIKQTH
jgi:hypothetical protein